MADAKDAKKDDKKAEAKPAAGSSKFYWEETVLLILGVITIFFVLIPKTKAPPAVDAFGNPVVPEVQSTGVNVQGWYDRLFNPTTEVIRDSQGEVINTETKPSLVDEAKFRATDIFQNLIYAFFFLSVFFCLLFGIIIYHNKVRLKFIKDEYAKKMGLVKTPEQQALVSKAAANAIANPEPPDTNGVRNPRWELVEKYYNSANQADWRLAIMEADIMLYDLLDKIGLEGNSIGDKLKNANQAQFSTLQVAWRSHLVRNRLAHDGSSFVLSRSLVEQAIAGYKMVFEEFFYI